MRDVAEYLAKAIEFDALAASAHDGVVRKRYADLAECSRLLAAVGQRPVAEGVLPEGPP